MPSSMKREYAVVPKGANIPRSSFDLSENYKTTFNGDLLIPIYWNWFYPGEVVRGKVQAFIRMSSPLDFPLMDNMQLTVHWYSVPCRQLWDNFRKFYGEQDDPGDSIDFTLPVLGAGWLDTSANNNNTKLARHLGCPIRTTGQGGVAEADLCVLPFRAYHHIWNWHYRDQQQQDSEYINTSDTDGGFAQYELLYRGKRHDYFTSALPSPQKGTTTGAMADVRIDSGAGSNPSVVYDPTGARYELDAGAPQVDVSATTGSASEKLYTELLISELRNAVAVQRFLEKDNRYGTRFDEQIYSHFGVEFNDVRIAPLYLGGGSGYINTSAIPNQSGSTGNVGDLAAIAHGALDGAGFTYAFDEPSILMGIACVTADQTYQQGLHKKWSYRTRYDLFWPEFVGIGDQAILNGELFYQNTADDDNVFGYVPRYEELRTGVNRVGGEFASDDPATLDSWHLAIDYGSLPVLGDTWIKSSTPYARVQQVATADDFLADFQINLRAARRLPVNGVPGLMRL